MASRKLTPTLEWVSTQGSYLTASGGNKVGKIQSPTVGFLTRQTQIKSLETKAATLQQQSQGLAVHLEELQQSQVQVETQLQDTQKHQHQAELALLSHHKELEHDLLELKRAQSHQQQFHADL